MTTLFGTDVSSYQRQLDLRALPPAGMTYTMIKATEGTGYVSPTFRTFLGQAKQARLLTAAYHYLTTGDPAAQARNFRAALGADFPRIPCMIDWEAWEPEGSGGPRYLPSIQVAERFLAEVRALGGRVTLLYAPRWFLDEIKAPAGLLARDPWNTVELVASSYGTNPAGYFRSLYPGDHSARWSPYHSAEPLILQYGSRGRLMTGYAGDLDVCAARVTRDQLARCFYDPAGVQRKLPGAQPYSVRVPGPGSIVVNGERRWTWYTLVPVFYVAAGAAPAQVQAAADRLREANRWRGTNDGSGRWDTIKPGAVITVP